MTTEQTETQTETKPTEVVAETTTENAPIVENVGEEIKEEVIVDNEDDYGWHQKPKVRNETPSSETPAVADNKSEIAALTTELNSAKATIAELTSKLAQFESVKNNPFIESWHDYAISTTEPEIGDFLKQIGAISVTAQLDEETKVKKFFELKAKELNISDVDLEEAVDEQYHNYLNEGTFKRASVKKEADEYLKSLENNKVSEIQNKWKQNNDKTVKSNHEWVNRQTAMFNEFLDVVIKKGRFNGRAVDAAWGKRIQDYAFTSNGDIFNPNYVQYTEDGDMLIPDLVEAADFFVNRKELKKKSENKIEAAKAEKIEDKAIESHKAAIAAEKVGFTSTDEEERKYQEAKKKFSGQL